MVEEFRDDQHSPPRLIQGVVTVHPNDGKGISGDRSEIRHHAIIQSNIEEGILDRRPAYLGSRYHRRRSGADLVSVWAHGIRAS